MGNSYAQEQYYHTQRQQFAYNQIPNCSCDQQPSIGEDNRFYSQCNFQGQHRCSCETVNHCQQPLLFPRDYSNRCRAQQNHKCICFEKKNLLLCLSDNHKCLCNFLAFNPDMFSRDRSLIIKCKAQIHDCACQKYGGSKCDQCMAKNNQVKI